MDRAIVALLGHNFIGRLHTAVLAACPKIGKK